MNKKAWWRSKTLWVNAIALVATAIQAKWGFVISPEYQGYALVAINTILRLVTKEPVGLQSETGE